MNVVEPLEQYAAWPGDSCPDIDTLDVPALPCAAECEASYLLPQVITHPDLLIRPGC
ncbi:MULTISPECIES: hypothetical protein [Pseudomonas]|uniref:hypothetical protein n=1 Tax=Pseudomonas TaxID=286 RepID=UPI000A60325B|nr:MULTISPECIES: hypothetical protein [Pseudomonas]MBH3462308.1 hypothetical protein [Pseudomonas putida]HEK0906718.1 hypothetical protein [Pseudomonas putida]HEK1770062.1 hypothetical protein [Pseudomonas putida]